MLRFTEKFSHRGPLKLGVTDPGQRRSAYGITFNVENLTYHASYIVNPCLSEHPRTLEIFVRLGLFEYLNVGIIKKEFVQDSEKSV